MKKHCISYPTESLIFCKLSLFFQNIARIVDSYSYKFISASILFHFTVILLRLEHALNHCRFTPSKPDKESHVTVYKFFLIRYYKWLSFQSAEYNHH